MRKTSTSQSGFFRPRLLVLLTLFSFGALLASNSVADPVPPNGTLTPANQTITYTDGPLATNPTHLVNGREAAVLLNLTAGNYTAVVRGVNRTTGIALAEAYKLN